MIDFKKEQVRKFFGIGRKSKKRVVEKEAKKPTSNFIFGSTDQISSKPEAFQKTKTKELNTEKDPSK